MFGAATIPRRSNLAALADLHKIMADDAAKMFRFSLS